jgi:hypothetical protein
MSVCGVLSYCVEESSEAHIAHALRAGKQARKEEL